MGLELIETYRNIDYVKEDGFLIYNMSIIYPPAFYSGNVKYPPKEEVINAIKRHVGVKVGLNFYELAEKAGSPKSLNVVMLGALYATGILPFEEKSLVSAIKKFVPRKYIELNLKAFKLGFNATKRYLEEV